jgi:hypothetical protein
MSKEKFLPLTCEFENTIIALLILDYTYWIKRQYEIETWCKDSFNNTLSPHGGLLYFDSEDDRMLFLLKWGNEHE